MTHNNALCVTTAKVHAYVLEKLFRQHYNDKAAVFSSSSAPSSPPPKPSYDMPPYSTWPISEDIAKEPSGPPTRHHQAAHTPRQH